MLISIVYMDSAVKTSASCIIDPSRRVLLAMCLGTTQPIYRWVSRSQAANHHTEQLPAGTVQLCCSVELNPLP